MIVLSDSINNQEYYLERQGKMKKIVALFLSVFMIFSLCTACSTNTGTESTEAQSETQKETQAETQAATETAAEAVEEEKPSVVNMKLVMLNSTQTALKPPTNCSHMDNALLFETLMRFDVEKGEYINVLAESYTRSDDGMTHTVTLKDATFQDGHPITAEDVLYTYNFNVQAAQPYANRLINIKGYEDVVSGTVAEMSGITAPDDKTVVFELTAPNFEFEQVLSNSNFGILPSHLLSDKPWADVLEYEDFWKQPVGSGPYMVSEIHYPNYIVLERFENYVMGTPGIKNIVMTAYEGDSAYAAGMAGEIDLIRQVTADAADTIVAANPSMKLEVCDAAYNKVLVMNLSNNGRDDLKNNKIRQALNMLVDKQMLVDYCGALTSVATTHSSSAYYNTDIPVWQRDVEGAVKILKEEGFDFNTPLKLYTNGTDQQTIDVMDMLIAQLAEGGISAEYYVDDKNAGEILYTTLDFDIYYGGNNNLAAGAYNLVKTGSTYDVWYTDEMNAEKQSRYTDLINAYSGTADATEKTQLLDQLQVNSMEDMYTIPLFFTNTGWMVADRFQGFAPYSVDYGVYAYLNTPKWSIAD